MFFIIGGIYRVNAKKIVRILAVFIFALTACGTADNDNNDELETKNNIEETENSSNDVTSESTEQESDADEDTSTDDSENEIEETTLEIQESVENNDKQDTAELVEENKPSESPKKTRQDEKKQKANSKSKANTPAATPESKPAPKPAPKNEPKPSPAPAPKPAELKKPESKPEIPKVEEPKQSNSSIDQAAFERKVAELTNKERVANGLAPLTFDSSLSNVARIKSNDMFKNNYFSHTSPTYGSPFDMMRQYGITYYSAAENIAMGQRTPEQVVQGWMNSPGHKANILNDSLTHIGVGLSDGNFYWTQMFIGK